MKQYIWVYFKGVAMGVVDIIPGVSGGTIAFITGIYERLIGAIKSINFKNLKLFFTGNFKEFWKNIDATFLLCLVLGIATGFLSLVHAITYLLENQPVLIWAFFFGLVLASTLFVGKTVKWNWKTVFAFLLFAVVSFFITSPENTPIATSSSYWFIFLCGAIAICVMILPAVSGAFILVLLGQYHFILNAVKTLDMLIILTFLSGALIGIISFSNVLSWLLKNFKMITLASLTGFMFGSLNKIWPWKETLSTYINKSGIEQALTEKNISPAKFEQLTGNSSQLFSVILLIVIGFSLVFVIEFISLKFKKRNKIK